MKNNDVSTCVRFNVKFSVFILLEKENNRNSNKKGEKVQVINYILLSPRCLFENSKREKKEKKNNKNKERQKERKKIEKGL